VVNISTLTHVALLEFRKESVQLKSIPGHKLDLNVQHVKSLLKISGIFWRKYRIIAESPVLPVISWFLSPQDDKLVAIYKTVIMKLLYT